MLKPDATGLENVLMPHAPVVDLLVWVVPIHRKALFVVAFGCTNGARLGPKAAIAAATHLGLGGRVDREGNAILFHEA